MATGQQSQQQKEAHRSCILGVFVLFFVFRTRRNKTGTLNQFYHILTPNNVRHHHFLESSIVHTTIKDLKIQNDCVWQCDYYVKQNKAFSVHRYIHVWHTDAGVVGTAEQLESLIASADCGV